jgi:hypothetical protein
LKNLFEPGRAEDVKARVAKLTAESERRWGKMTPAQAMAHCSKGLEMAVGDAKPPRMFVGRIFGGLIKRLALGDDKPIKKESPTVPSMVMHDVDCDLDAERTRLTVLIDRFVAAGPAGTSTHPHPFFGRLRGEEWAILMYKHLDNHLRQFGA